MSETKTVPRRDEQPVEYTWDLTTVYADDAAWEQDIARLEGLVPEAATMQGQITESADALLRALTVRDEIEKGLWQVYIYANCRHDANTTDPVGQAINSKVGSVVAQIGAALAFIEPEILSIPDETLRTWIDQTHGLHVYRYALEQLLRKRAHVRSAEVENVIAQLGDVTRAPSEVYEILTNADLEFPTIQDENGQEVKLSYPRFGRFMENNDRRVRQDAFKGMYAAFKSIRSTIGTTLAAETRSHVVNARLRGYDSALQAALAPNDIPLDVYHNLIATINANLPKLHRYMGIRKRALGLDDLRIYDLYAHLVPDVDVVTPYAEARKLVTAAFQPLGADYADALHKTFTSRWIDVYENVGKRSGAYSDGAYTTAPFILLNYQNRLNDMFTLAHELGHSMHSYFTRRTQPFVYGNYTIFVAEVASTLNEALLTDYLLKNRDDPALRKHLIVQQLDDIRSTIFRQTMFAEFELDIHTRTEQGEPLTADNLSSSYYELVKKFHGAEVVLDDEIAWEWSRIPHFYYNFYVYQYATGLSAALALSKQIIAEGQPAVDRYLQFLGGGSSTSSIELLRGAGVDMTTPAPIQAAMDEFERLMDEFEAL